MGKLDGRRVAIIAADGFEQSELMSPREALENAGATCEVLSLHEGSIRGFKDKQWGDEVKVDRLITAASAHDYDALLLPGGVMSPDQLRQDDDVIRVVQEFFDAGKPIAAICHGPQVLIETGELEGRQLTSYPSIKTDLINAGGDWVDREVVEDENLVTSRRPSDLPAFNAALLRAFATPEAPVELEYDARLESLMTDATLAPVPASGSTARRKNTPLPLLSDVPRRPDSGRGAMARRPSLSTSRRTKRPTR